MSEETAVAETEPTDGEPATVDDVWTRDTAPQTPYTMRQVGIGLVVFAVAAVVAFVVPLGMA